VDEGRSVNSGEQYTRAVFGSPYTVAVSSRRMGKAFGTTVSSACPGARRFNDPFVRDDVSRAIFRDAGPGTGCVVLRAANSE